jgi:hypothetical protein
MCVSIQPARRRQRRQSHEDEHEDAHGAAHHLRRMRRWIHVKTLICM